MATTTIQNSTESMKGSKSKKAVKAIRRVQTRNNAKKAAEGVTAKFYREGKDAISSAYENATKAGAKVGSALPKLGNNLHLRDRGQSLYTMMEERPLVMGAVGLGVGMVLAALLPSVSSHRNPR